MGRPRTEGNKEDPANIVKMQMYAWAVVLEQFDALSEQRKRESPRDYQRRAEYIGSLFLAIEGEPGPDGNYGLYSREDLLTRIRPYLVMGNDWLSEQGHPILPPQPPLFPPDVAAALLELLQGGGLSQRGSTAIESAATNGHWRDDAANSGVEVVPVFDLESMNLE